MILVVDDEPNLRTALCLTLEAAGYQVLLAVDGVEALALLETHSVDLVLADIAMPHMNGYQLLERVRENADWAAILFVFLTARAMDSDIRYGKEMGVDDYLTKPIDPEDLMSAVRGKLRRADQLAHQAPIGSGPRQGAGAIEIGALQVDPAQHRVWFYGQEIKLSAREFILLENLARRPNHVMSPEVLIWATHGLKVDSVEAGALLRPLVRSLRRKLGYPVGEMGCLENVRGVGYRLTLSDS